MSVKEKLRNITYKAWGPEPYQCQILFKDFNWLRDTVKQQNEQIEGITYWRNFYHRKLEEKEQRIEELKELLEQSPEFKELSIRLANQDQHIQRLKQKLGEIDLSGTERYRYNCIECEAEYESHDPKLKYCDSEQCLDKDVELLGPYLIEE